MPEKHANRMRNLEESEAMSRKYGIRTLYLHLSALSPTTRKSHADRHGKLFAAQEVRDFWEDPANVEGCECDVTAVTVDDDGEPIVPLIVERARATYENMKARGYDWSKGGGAADS